MPQIINTLAINDVLPGMCLATDLRNAHGNLLLPRHTELTSQLINGLRTLGIASLQINSPLPTDAVANVTRPGSQEVDATLAARHYQQQYDNIVNEVRQMFPVGNLDSVNHALQQAILEHRLAQLPPRPPAPFAAPLPAAPQVQPDPPQ